MLRPVTPWCARGPITSRRGCRGFPDGRAIEREGALARAVAVYLCTVSVFHTGDHHSYANIGVDKLPWRLRVAMPAEGPVARVDPDALVSAEDVLRWRLAHAMFFKPSVITSLRDVKYRFRSAGGRRAVTRWRDAMTALDERWSRSGFRAPTRSDRAFTTDPRPWPGECCTAQRLDVSYGCCKRISLAATHHAPRSHSEVHMELNGAVAVITGGASGIGEAVARSMAAEGVKVVLGDMDARNLERVAGEITAAGGSAAWARCNVTNEEDVAALMDLAIERFGSLNICVSSAGIIKDGLMINLDKETGKVKRAMTTEQFKAVVDVNLVGSFITIREAAIRMANNGYKGLLVPISSPSGQLNYASTKAAVALWPKILVGEFQMKGIQNIRCVAIAPGYVGTPMVKGMNQEALAGILKGVHINRLIEPSEIADIIMFAAKNEAIDATCLDRRPHQQRTREVAPPTEHTERQP